MTTRHPEPGAAGTTGMRRTLSEVQGLRALAALLVVVYHVWVGRVSGGVDVFFVLTGFLLVGTLVRAAETGRLEVLARWNRTLFRLVPAAAVVLVGTALGALWVLPELRWGHTIRDLVASALHVQNWALAADAVDYAARSNATSVVQHFWSLSIQVQVSLLLPLLVAAVALASRRRPERIRDRTTLVLAAVALSSFVYAVDLVAVDQPLAYFHTVARLWEFAVGGLLALHLERITPAAWSARTAGAARITAGWVGVIALVATGMVLPVENAFPGWAALWPVAATALILFAATGPVPCGVGRLLSLAPVRYLGELSFGWYLWHWPLLILHLARTGQTEVSWRGGAVIILGSLVLAALTHHLVERPLLGLRPGRRTAARLTAAATAVLLVGAGVWQVVAVARDNALAAEIAAHGPESYPGAAALLGAEVPPAPVLPTPATVYEDWVRIDHWDCAPMAGFPQDACTLTATDDDGTPREPQRRLVVVGDSHIQQFAGALAALARVHDWEITAMARGACPFSTASEVVPDEPDCLAWNAAAVEEIAARSPDAVVTLASRDVRVGLTEQTPVVFVEAWRGLDELGFTVLAVRDNPRFDYSVPECVAQRTSDPTADPMTCGVERAQVYAAEPPWSQHDDVPANVAFLDVADAYCDGDFCPPVIGNVSTYLDDNHISATYSASMAGLLDEPVRAALGW